MTQAENDRRLYEQTLTRKDDLGEQVVSLNSQNLPVPKELLDEWNRCEAAIRWYEEINERSRHLERLRYFEEVESKL